MSMSYRSYCWVMGTTSFRTDQLNRKIEIQLRCLDEFWRKSAFASQSWAGNEPVQAEYYKLLKKYGYVSGDAPRPAKDARQKTSGLVELGLIDAERRLTSAGKEVLNVSIAGDFRIDEEDLLELAKDSRLYFLQLLKATKTIDLDIVRPFVVLLSILNRIETDVDGRRYLSAREFTELLPLCINRRTTDAIVAAISDARRRGITPDVDGIILSILMGMENYREAMSFFVAAKIVDEGLMCKIGMNRKSGADGSVRYDAAYSDVYHVLRAIVFDGITEAKACSLVDRVNRCKQGRMWIDYLFERPTGKRLPRRLAIALKKHLQIFKAESEDDFRSEFFKIMHLLKAKSTLKDYADLNRRYFALADVVVFNEGKVYLDCLPQSFAARIPDWLESQAFLPCPKLPDAISLEALIGRPLPEKGVLVADAVGGSPESVRQEGGIREVMRKNRKSRFDKMLIERFPRSTVERLLELVEDRKNDRDVQKAVTDNADMPTIFEYLVALAWYYISGMQGDVLAYMNLSLGADFTPKTHAGGGEADIVWQYAADMPRYPEHALLIEVTLAEKDTQRRMEMEPVSRHLGEYRLAHPGDEVSYCTFVTTNLDFNVIADFRGKRNQTYYRRDDAHKKVCGLKIIPIDTQMLRRMLEKRIDYATVCETFSRHDALSGDPVEWHDALRREIEA